MQYTVMAFSMRNAPATFQCLMQCVLGSVANCSVYLDAVVVCSQDWGDHLSSLMDVFKQLADASLTLNLAKCEFWKATVTYLGKQVGHGQGGGSAGSPNLSSAQTQVFPGHGWLLPVFLQELLRGGRPSDPVVQPCRTFRVE